jgi:hypothetical protein
MAAGDRFHIIINLLPHAHVTSTQAHMHTHAVIDGRPTVIIIIIIIITISMLMLVTAHNNKNHDIHAYAGHCT